MYDDDRDFKIVRAMVYALRLLGERPSALKVIAMIKAAKGHGMRKESVCAHMKALFLQEHLSGNLSGTIRELSGAEPEPILSTTGTDPEQTGTIPEHHAQIINKKQEDKELIAPAAEPPEPTEEKLRKKKRATRDEVPKEFEQPKRKIPPLEDPSQPLWVIALRKRVGDWFPRRLVELNSTERFALAQYHAWRWGNCTKDELANRKRASNVATGITNLATHKEFGILSVSDYMAAAETVWEQRGGSPWFKPWDITGQVEPSQQLREKATYVRAN